MDVPNTRSLSQLWLCIVAPGIPSRKDMATEQGKRGGMWPKWAAVPDPSLGKVSMMPRGSQIPFEGQHSDPTGELLSKPQQ